MAGKEVRMKKGAPPLDIDAYLATVPEDARTALQKLRQIIKTAAPKADEVISYQIPTFRYMGSLVAFAAFKNHCSFFVMSPAVLAAYQDALQSYETAKATVQFKPSRPLPATLVKKLVKARMAENEMRRKKSGGH